MPADPQVPGAASSRKGAESTVIISSLVVLVLWSYRKLVEPSVAQARKEEPKLAQIIGTAPKPASASTFAVAFGFVFFTLSIGAAAAPELASAFAILIAVSYTITNGASVFADIAHQVGSAKEGEPAGGPLAGVSGGFTPAPGGPVQAGGPVAGLRGSTVAPPSSLTGLTGGYKPTELSGLTGSSR